MRKLICFIAVVLITLSSGCVGDTAVEEDVTFELKDAYELGEVIETVAITTENNIYYCQVGGQDLNGWSIYKLVEEKWTKIDSTSITLKCECIDSQLACSTYEPPVFIRITASTSFVWNQKIHTTKTEKCGDESYGVDVEHLTEGGRYKAEFCYYENVDEGGFCGGVEEVSGKKCIAQEFVINQ